ncbi:MAG: hypothetical protein KF774_10525 [Planctomyces sp.]|nr:hypothetical protein [Planctomyces sp.]
MLNFQPVLADALGTLLTVAFIVITIIGWIINAVNAQAKPQAQNRGSRQATPRSERVQSEIDQFLRDQGSRRASQTATQTPSRAETPARSSGPRRAPARPQPAPQARRSSRAPAQSQQPAPQPERAPRRAVANETLGQAIGQHVREAMQDRVSAEVQQHLQHAVDASVSQHLGAIGAQPASAQPTSAALLRSLMTDLRSPEGFRKAFVMKEILDRPRSLRHEGNS